AMSSGRKAPMSKPRDTVEIPTPPLLDSHPLAHVLGGEPVATSPGHALAKNRDDAVQRLGRGLLVVHHGDADVVRAGIAAVELLARAVASGQHAHAAPARESCCCGLAPALRRNVEPQEEAAGRPAIAVAVADDLVGEIELQPVEVAIRL